MTKMKEERKGWKKIEKEKPKQMRCKNWMKKKKKRKKERKKKRGK